MTDICDRRASAGCPLADAIDRRSFLRDASIAAAAALVAVGAPSSVADAMSAEVGAIAPLRSSAEEKVYAIPAADGALIDKASDTIVARWQSKVYVFNLACPHQNTAIKWQVKNNRFECPKHHSRYTPDGTFIEGRATRGLDRFAVRREGNTVVANLDRLYEQDKQKDQWTAAFVAI